MFAILYSNDVVDFIKSLENKSGRQVWEKLAGLCQEPRPISSTPLVAHKGYRRLRVGDFRVVYSVTETQVRIVLIDRRNDDEVYRALDRVFG